MKKMIALALSCVIATGSVVTGFAQQLEENINVVLEETENGIKENVNEISEKDAELVAKQFIISRSKAPGVTETFPENFTLEKNITMYDLSDTPSAYKFDVLDENGSYSGYIVIGAQKCYHPVIEFSCSDGESIFDIAANKTRNANKMYYIGGIDYLVENEAEELVDLDGQNIGTYSELQGTLKKARDSEDEFKNEWNDALERASRVSEIQDPADIEEDWDDFDGQEMYDYNTVQYITQSKYPDSDNCSAVATVNAFAYCDEIHGMSKLKLNGSWDATYRKILQTSGAAGGGGVLAKDLFAAIKAFINDVGVTRLNCSYSTRVNTDTIRSNIINDSPQILFLMNNKIYNDHFVLVVSYEKYMYDRKDDKIYFGIIGGRTTSVRYIPYDKTSNSVITLSC